MLHKEVSINPELAAYSTQLDTSLSAAAKALYAESSQHELAQRLSTLDTGAFLAMLVRSSDAKRILEIGTFTGFATLCMAEALSEDGEVVTLEKDQRFLELALPHWKAAGVRERISAHIADARSFCAELPQDELFDFIFIDADKGSYEQYYEAAVAHLAPDGIIVIDNTLWRGLVADETANDTITKTIRAFNAYVANDPRVRATIFPIGDGLTVVTKR